KPFTPPDRILQQLERVGVRFALEEILGVRRQAERFFGEAEVFLVHVVVLDGKFYGSCSCFLTTVARAGARIVGVSRITKSLLSLRVAPRRNSAPTPGT